MCVVQRETYECLYRQTEQWFYLKIYDDDNHTDWIEGEYEASDLNNMIVGLEIISFESDGDDDNEK